MEMGFYNNETLFVDEHRSSVRNILDVMQDWVRVIDLNDNILYANKAMKEALGCWIVGKKCFEIIGRDTPCENCISKQAITLREPMYKEETINNRIYSVLSSPLKNVNGDIDAVVEVLRDVTNYKKMENEIRAQNEKLHKDLQMARRMQYSLLPKLSELRGIKIAYTYKPCEVVSGDFFDIFPIDDLHVGVYIADVSGHGVSSSMLTIIYKIFDGIQVGTLFLKKGQSISK
jgi:sigma-B regulation protein RsbU (phosphoserine phosphatase)